MVSAVVWLANIRFNNWKSVLLTKGSCQHLSEVCVGNRSISERPFTFLPLQRGLAKPFNKTWVRQVTNTHKSRK